jgi:hypothetical protein
LLFAFLPILSAAFAHKQALPAAFLKTIVLISTSYMPLGQVGPVKTSHSAPTAHTSQAPSRGLYLLAGAYRQTPTMCNASPGSLGLKTCSSISGRNSRNGQGLQAPQVLPAPQDLGSSQNFKLFSNLKVSILKPELVLRYPQASIFFVSIVRSRIASPFRKTCLG